MTGPFSFDEVAARLKAASDAELVAINQLELLASRASTHEPANPAIYQLTVGETRRQAEALAFGFVPRANAPVRRDGGDLERVESVDVHLACVEVGNCACRANGFRTSPTHPRHRTAIGKPGKLAWRPSHNGAAVRMDALDQRRHPQRRHLLLRKARLVRA